MFLWSGIVWCCCLVVVCLIWLLFDVSIYPLSVHSFWLSINKGCIINYLQNGIILPISWEWKIWNIRWQHFLQVLWRQLNDCDFWLVLGAKLWLYGWCGHFKYRLPLVPLPINMNHSSLVTMVTWWATSPYLMFMIASQWVIIMKLAGTWDEIRYKMYISGFSY